MVNVVGVDCVGFCLSFFSLFQGMFVLDLIFQYEDVIQKVKDLGLMYLSMIEGWIFGMVDVNISGNFDFVYRLWEGFLFVVGGYIIEKVKFLVDVERL